MTRADEPWLTPRPETQRYHRPTWGIWHAWEIWHGAQTLAYTGLATTASAVLAVIRVWRHFTEPDETGD